MDFWNSEFMKNLGKGELPEVPISFEKSTIVYFSGALFLVGLVLILIAYVINKK